MRELAGTAITIALIAIAVVLLLMAPKGFELAPPDPVVLAFLFPLPFRGPHHLLRLRRNDQAPEARVSVLGVTNIFARCRAGSMRSTVCRRQTLLGTELPDKKPSGLE